MRKAMIVGLAMLAMGCVKVEVSTRFEPDTDFRRYATYAQSTPPEGPIVAETVVEEIERVLEDKGYRDAPIEDADMVVSFDAWADPGQRAQISSDPGANYFVVRDYIEGTLVIEIFDRVERVVVWRGVGRVDITEERDAQRAARAAVRKILAELPDPGP